MACCGEFIDGLLTLVVDSMQNSFELEEITRPPTPAPRGELKLTYKIHCSTPGSFIVSPINVIGERPTSPIIPTLLTVESFSNDTSFEVDLRSTLRCSTKELQMEPHSAQPEIDICILDTRDRLDTAQRFGLTPEDTEDRLKEAFSHYNSADNKYYVDNTHSISRYVHQEGLASSVMRPHAGGLGASSGLVVLCIGRSELERAVYTLSDAAQVLERVSIDQVALIVQLRGEPVEPPQELHCTIKMEYSH